MVKNIPESPEHSSTDHSYDNASQSSHLSAISSAHDVQNKMPLESSETLASSDNKEEEEKEPYVQVLSMKKID